eukprot:3940270-Rhodomonas_salina.2
MRVLRDVRYCRSVSAAYQLAGTEVAYLPTREIRFEIGGHPASKSANAMVLRQPAMSLRACYAMSGTTSALWAYAGAMRCPVSG